MTANTRLRPKRLPVFFLIDDSAAMAGAMSVAASEGLQAFQRDLERHPATLRSVYLSVVLLNDQTPSWPLVPISRFTPPSLRAEGDCHLGAGLQCVCRTLEDAFVIETADRRGDLHPLVFIVLGGNPKHDSHSRLDAFINLEGPMKPRSFITTGGDSTSELSAIGGHIFKLMNATGNNMANVFTWATEVVIAICEAQIRGDHTLNLPAYPASLRLVS